VVQIFTFYSMAHIYDFLVKLSANYDEQMGDKWLKQVMTGLMMLMAAVQVI